MCGRDTRSHEPDLHLVASEVGTGEVTVCYDNTTNSILNLKKGRMIEFDIVAFLAGD